MESGFRELDARERGLLEKLLEPEFPGRDELRVQLSSLTAKQAGEDGTLLLRCGQGPAAPTRSRLVAEATYQDADGGRVSVLLHVNKDGLMQMLEIIKYDGSPIVRPPSARELVVLPAETRGHKQ
jgi:hypothetical protein